MLIPADKNAFLMRLSERGRFWSVPFEDLSSAEQVFRSIWDLESDVNNGGFDQYYFNSSGDTAFAVVDALEKVGAQAPARIVAQANSIFPEAIPPTDRDRRQEILALLTPEMEAVLQVLDERFTRYPDNLTDLLFDYVSEKAAEIHGAQDSIE